MEQPLDKRHEIYSKLHGGQLNNDRDQNAHSAEVILRMLFEYFEAKSILDIGCGLGTWLKVASQMGLEIAGVEGPWCEVDKLEVEKNLVTITDLEMPIILDRKFDLAISLEVGEHLSDKAAPNLVDALTSHSDYVIFSAAVPFQGGQHHVNEQYMNYWVKLFGAAGYQPLDLFRPLLWDDESIHWWLRQNIMFFAPAAIIESNPRLKAESLIPRPMDVIHPYVFVRAINRMMGQMREMQEKLLRTGNARLRQTPSGPVFEIVEGSWNQFGKP